MGAYFFLLAAAEIAYLPSVPSATHAALPPELGAFVFEAWLMGTEPVLLSDRRSVMEQIFFFFLNLL